MTPASLEVWGDPIGHSLSPRLHRAAYVHLGLPWTYERRRVDAASFAGELAAARGRLRGLSLTMPLKAVAWASADRRDTHAQRTGAVNTLLLGDDGLAGFNTDVGGIVRALADEGLRTVTHARIVGAGATATSALVALLEAGAREIEVVARRSSAVEPLLGLGSMAGAAMTHVPFGTAVGPGADVTVATLPGGVVLPDEATAPLAAGGGLLFDVVYGTWPTDLARAWRTAGHRAVDGTGMLLHQALLQVRLFVSGDVHRPLPDEERLMAVMRDALVGD